MLKQKSKEIAFQENLNFVTYLLLEGLFKYFSENLIEFLFVNIYVYKCLL